MLFQLCTLPLAAQPATAEADIYDQISALFLGLLAAVLLGVLAIGAVAMARTGQRSGRLTRTPSPRTDAWAESARRMPTPAEGPPDGDDPKPAEPPPCPPKQP